MIVGMADIYPGATVIEAGAGSGAMTCSLLRAVGDEGQVHSYERREDFAEIAAANVQRYFGQEHPAWEITVGDLVESINDTDVDRVILDMLAPWECVEVVHKALRPEAWSASTSPPPHRCRGPLKQCVNTAVGPNRNQRKRCCGRGMWKVAVRPNHRMVGHTGFLITARRLADGVELPPKRTRPSKGAYGQDWQALVNAQTKASQSKVAALSTDP